MRTCPKCGAQLVIEHPMGPTMWVERCTACSYEDGGTASFNFGLPRDPDSDAEVSGYFQLSDLAQFAKLRALLPELRGEPSAQIIQLLRSDELRWHVPSLKKWKAKRYQREAADHGLKFIIET